MFMTHPHLHLHKRKTSGFQAYPSKNKKIQLLDRIIYVVGVLGPIMTIPQVWQIWMYERYEGVSLITWTAYLLFSVLWTIYGYVHKENAIVISSALSIAVQLLIIAGVLLFR